MSVFSGKFICSECGNKFGSKTWHSNDQYRRIVWQCNGKYLKSCGCKTLHLTENEIKTAFIKAQNSLMAARRAVVMEAIEKATMVEFSTSKCENKLSSVNQEIELLSVLCKRF
ncbi:MAG: zinc ribbon domain-containing protein [Spirochaetales bacterium]|nr:zinc ribbon domain-containing protein [Spirochaetales bacterium]